MGNMVKVDYVPQYLCGVDGYLVEFVEKPRFFSQFDEENIKKEWFSAPALGWTLREDRCKKVLLATRMNMTEYQKLHKDIIVNYWLGSMERFE